MTSKELRKKWLDFYEKRGHVNIGAVSLVGDGTTGVMFNVAGMQPLMPYLLGKKHPCGTRLCNVQGCVRTVDIESVGDNSHHTFFEMMGNWSLGDYFKAEKTKWTFEFLTQVMGYDKNKLCSSVFAGDENAPRDDETANLLLSLGMKKENIFFLPKSDNWWELEGTTGTPCGPDNEWFYPSTDTPCKASGCDITCDCGRYVEIGNDVYMQYEKVENGYKELANKNVDTGFGFERNLMFINGVADSYKTDLFTAVVAYLEKASGKNYDLDEDAKKAMRIIADHTRTAVMLIGDKNSVAFSNVGAGYILRRLVRRAIRYCKMLGVDFSCICEVAKIFITQVYDEAYPNLLEKQDHIITELQKEIAKFKATLEQGIKEFEKNLVSLKKKNEFMMSKDANYVPETTISGKAAFRLYDTFGFPLELTKELATECGLDVDEAGYAEAFKLHQEKSKMAPGQTFKGGLCDDSKQTACLHTATHIMLACLKNMFGKDVVQKGSNITPERLRFDFNLDHKLTEQEIKQIEQFVNNTISRAIDVTCEEMTLERAKEIGAHGVFESKYGEKVKVYIIGDVDKQICGGPHAKNTSELGVFKITKEESSSAGIRRIKAILTK